MFWHDAVAAALAADVTQGQDAKRRPEARRRHTALSNFHHQSYPQTTRETPSTPPGHTNTQSRWYVEPLNQDFPWAVASRSFAVANGGGVKQLHLFASAAAANSFTIHYLREYMLTQYYSLRPKSYVQSRSHRSLSPTEYSQPLQKTAQLWNKSKEDLASQLSDLKSYVANLQKLGGMEY
jgi:hypothetical protein